MAVDVSVKKSLTAMKTIELTDSDFDQILTGGTYLIDFGAEWCGPCKLMGPAVDSLAVEFNSRATVAKIDVDSNPETTVKYGIRNLPTFVIIQSGRVVDKVVGAVPISVLREKLEVALRATHHQENQA